MTAKAPNAAPATGLADGEWHRLHPASPLLRGGLALLAILGFVIANLRERLVELFIPIFAPDLGDEFDEEFSRWQGDWASDPIGGLVMNGLVGWALIGVAVILIAIIFGFWLSWRMHTFRVTDESVEVRSGILFRSHRSARLDRIQGINVARPLFARLFGAAKLDVSVAGQSGNVQLSYLGSALADGLRADILRLASGARAAKAAVQAGPVTDASAAAGASQQAAPAEHTASVEQPDPAAIAGAAAVPGATEGQASGDAESRGRVGELVNRRVGEFLAPELDPDLAPPESVVHIPLGRVIGSTALGGAMIWMLVLVGVLAVGVATRTWWVLFSFIPALIGLVSYVWSRITRSLRYSIAGTPDGVRIGHGLLSTANQTLPPGRVHAVQATQWLLWRPFGWWSVKINIAGQSLSASNEAAQRTVVLPVGTADDVRRVLDLLLPGAAEALGDSLTAGLTGRGADGGFEPAPRRAAWLHPFSWRRIGWLERDGVAAIRHGVLLRGLSLVPLARLQSVAIQRGPLRRMLRLATLRLHTVAGPVTPTLPAIDEAAATAAFDAVARESVARAAADTTHHWGAAHG
ncbi:PH domain-containing protein [Agromyces aerolatus]|uniref:PH domain-containing protein n=1 Tax=Agromyces sp. LY-1074 TaxID=3074080 RepID=UPI00285FC88E|nr:MULTISPECIES: PH domain-containing protein [unclassified Agromyces]MDR5698481.1 PH domain-containing protein [Agromyces sp. LY-1074]MDR5704775.1 PH domain-containing protein [Agromyces sp. LY-1358]